MIKAVGDDDRSSYEYDFLKLYVSSLCLLKIGKKRYCICYS